MMDTLVCREDSIHGTLKRRTKPAGATPRRSLSSISPPKSGSGSGAGDSRRFGAFGIPQPAVMATLTTYLPNSTSRCEEVCSPRPSVLFIPVAHFFPLLRHHPSPRSLHLARRPNCIERRCGILLAAFWCSLWTYPGYVRRLNPVIHASAHLELVLKTRSL